jgi:hypothetical protein
VSDICNGRTKSYVCVPNNLNASVVVMKSCAVERHSS